MRAEAGQHHQGEHRVCMGGPAGGDGGEDGEGSVSSSRSSSTGEGEAAFMYSPDLHGCVFDFILFYRPRK